MWTIAAALALVGCSRHAVYSHYEPIDMEGWERSDTIYFTVTTPRQEGTFATQVHLRINDTFPFQEITLLVHQQHSSTHVTTTDTVSIHTTNHEGHFIGKGLSMLVYTASLGTIQMSTTDTLKVAIHHIMRRETINGISDIGFTLKSEN